MTGLLHPAITEILLQQFARDTRLIPLLDRTCTAFRDQIVPTQEMRAIQAWLEDRAWRDEPVETDDCYIFSECVLTPTHHPSTWRLDARTGRRSVQLFYTSGLLTLHKNCCSLTLLADPAHAVFKDSFRGVPDLASLIQCMSTHTILCHELPQNVPVLPRDVRHRHRDTVRWTHERAFRVWRASTPGGRRRRPDHRPPIHIIRYAVIRSVNAQRVVTWHEDVTRED